jgi:peptidoglycan glycosyltransferase
MVVQIRRLAAAFVAAFLLMALAAGYWSFARSDSLLARGDNPRRILDERRTPRGTIYDRHDQVLAEPAGVPGALTRHYPYPALATVLGYVSPVYGLAGVEAALDETLHGSEGVDAFDLLWRGTVLGQPPPGRAVRLTLDLTVQTAADEALGARAGAVVVLDIRTGHLLALASHPAYDANELESAWETLVGDPNAPLLNRATLGLYHPGGALWPVTLAAAAQAEPSLLVDTYPDAARPVTAGEQTLGCRVTPPLAQMTLRESLLFGCPAPVAAAAEAVGPVALDSVLSAFEVFTSPGLALQTTAAEAAPVTDSTRTGLGLEAWTVTPLRVALMLAAIAGDGTMPSPQIVLATQGTNGIWRPATPEGQAVEAIDPQTAAQVKTLLPQDGYVATAQEGPDGEARAWYLNFAPRVDTRYVVVVLLEDEGTETARQIGQAALAAARVAHR